MLMALAGRSQTVSLNLTSGSTPTAPTLALNLSATTGSSPAGVQFTLAYPAATSNVTVNAGPAATAAGKTILCTGPAGTKTCLVSGISNSAMSNGVVATITAASGTTLTTFQANTGAAVDPSGSRLPTLIQTSIGTPVTTPPVTTPPTPAAPTLQGLACAASQLVLSSPVQCTVSLSSPAPAGGATVSVASNNLAMVPSPGKITIAAGATQQSFSVVQQALPTSSATILLTAAYGTQTLTANLNLAVSSPTSQLQRIYCNATQLGLKTNTQCTVSLSTPAPAGGATILLSSSNPSLSVPSGIALAPGGSQGTFIIVQTAVSATSAKLSATYSGQTTSTTVGLASR